MKSKKIYLSSLLLILSLLLVSCANYFKLKVGFSTCILHVTYTESYCMGMRPTQEMLDTLAKPRPYIGKTLYLKKGEINDPKAPVVQTIITKSGGEISLNDLYPGKYYLIDEDRLHQIEYYKLENISVSDQNCIDKWFKKPLLTFEIKKNKKQHLYFKLNFHKTCYQGESGVPCTQYTGPQKP